MAVTGGAGFIGSHAVDRFLERGHEVVVLDDLSTGSRANLPDGDRLTVIGGDVRDRGAARRCVDGCDAVVHLAAIASVERSVRDPEGTADVNVGGTRTMLEAAQAAGVRRFVFASSAAVYGDATPPPVSEGAPPDPRSPYAEQKLAAERMVLDAHQPDGLASVALRFFNVYGPRQDPSSPYSGVISIFADRVRRGEPVTVHGDGGQTRDFVYVADVVETIVRALEWERRDEPHLINVGRGRPSSLLEVLDALERIAGTRVEREFTEPRRGDIRDSWADVSRLAALAGWTPPTTLEDGLRARLRHG